MSRMSGHRVPWRRAVLWSMLVSVGLPVHVAAQSVYADARGDEIEFPLGDVSFADEVVDFQPGDPPTTQSGATDPDDTLGPPDWANDLHALTLGCGGTLTLRFTDNVLVDTAGADLFVFEAGRDIEPTLLSISKDGLEWREVGQIEGAAAEVDISAVVESDEIFQFVRLQDLAERCSGRWPGADIDAVGAIGAAVRYTLESAVLFDFDQATLKSEALAALDDLVGDLSAYKGVRLQVGGHTDDTGSDAYNLALSQRRAGAVSDYLCTRVELAGVDITAVGYGEARPRATNEDDEGRATNRRVELLVLPGG